MRLFLKSLIGMVGLWWSAISLAGYTLDPHDPEIRGRLWEGGIIPYTIDPALDARSRDTIAKSIADYHSKTVLKWVPRGSQKDYVYFRLASFEGGVQGGAALGKQMGKQEIWMQQGGGYAGTGTIIHEMGHTIGLLHEHTHPDILKWVEFTGDLSKEWDKVCFEFFLGHTVPRQFAFQGISDEAWENFVSEAKNGSSVHFEPPTGNPSFNLANEPRGRSHYYMWDSESIMSTAHGCWLNPPNDSRGMPAVLRTKPSYPGNKVVRDWFVLSKGDAITINALYADKTPSKHAPSVCEDDPLVGTAHCVREKAKGWCENYSMQIAAWLSCKATCDLCKPGSIKPTPAPEAPAPAPAPVPAPTPVPTPTPTPTPDEGYAQVKPVVRLADTSKQMIEISGIDASYQFDDIFYAHNDSGDSPRFWAFNYKTGAVIAEFKVSGAQARDWEDMTTAPCLSSSCVYIADFGDNNYNRGTYQIYEIEEPRNRSSQTLKAKTYNFTYGDGKAHNSEGFAYNPADGYFYIATKDDNALYRFPRTISDKMIAYKVCDFDVSRATNRWITGLDFSDSGEMLLRTYSDYFRFKGPDCGKIIDVQSYGIVEQQGEAVAYLQDGRTKGFISVSEGMQPAINLVVGKGAIVPAPSPPPPHPAPPAESQICKDAKILIQQHGCKL